jgi:hypothetical protein
MAKNLPSEERRASGICTARRSDLKARDQSGAELDGFHGMKNLPECGRAARRRAVRISVIDVVIATVHSPGYPDYRTRPLFCLHLQLGLVIALMT